MTWKLCNEDITTKTHKESSHIIKINWEKNGGFLQNVKSLSKFFHLELNKIKEQFPKIIKEVRGRGLLIGLQLNFDQTKFIQQLMNNKLLTIRAAENVIRILPPLNVKKNEINQSLKIIKKVCSELN